MPADAIGTLKVLVAALERLEAEISRLDAEIARRANANELARRLMTVPGIGPLIATAVAVLAPPPETFRKARDFAAWLGLAPRQLSTGGKQRLGATTKMGERSIRRRLISGAYSVIIKRHVHASARQGTWLSDMLTRRPPMLVRVAPANSERRAPRGSSRPRTRGSSGHSPLCSNQWRPMAHWPGAASTSLRPRRCKPTVGREDEGREGGQGAGWRNSRETGSGEPVRNRVPPGTRL